MGGRNAKRHGGAEDALAMLDRCHHKTSEKIELLLGAAQRWAKTGDRDSLEDAKSVSSFLGRSAHRHARDEEESIFPRIPETAGLGDVIRVLQAEHRDHEREGQALAELLSRRGGPDPDELLHCAARLASAYRSHIALEDARLMPVIARMPKRVLGQIYDEMQARRR